jgi:hypothetical protein
VAGGLDSDGDTICIGKPDVPKSPNTVTKAPVTVNNADGSTTTTVTTTTINSDGSITTSNDITTKFPDGSTSHQQTGGTGSSNTGAPGVPDPDKDDFCAKHAELTMCRNSTVSGSCAAVTCNGDAIQCSILQQAADMDCRQRDDLDALTKDPLTADGKAILAGSDPMQAQIDTLKAGDTVDLSSTSLDSSGFLGGGSCFADKSFTVAGRAVTVSFSSICDHIQGLRYAVLACAGIIAYMLVSKSIIQGA